MVLKYKFHAIVINYYHPRDVRPKLNRQLSMHQAYQKRAN